MKKVYYSIYDTASGVYNQPFLQHSDKEAKRSFEQLATDDETQIGKHPEDYYLVRVGQFDDTKGTLIPEDRETICTALECIADSNVTSISAGGTG